MAEPGGALRSARWFSGNDLAGFIHRASLHGEGISRSALSGRPVVGICNSWSELVSCNLHFRSLAEAVKRGVLLAGGLPLEFPTIALGENLMKPTAMLFRNLMSMDVEECIRAYPFDSVVLLGGCDKTVPAQLMGAARARRRARARRAETVGDPHCGRVRQRDHGPRRTRRRHERRRAPARPRRSRRRVADARPLPRARVAYAAPRERSSVGRAPRRATAPRGRRAGAAARARAAPSRGRRRD